MFVTVFGMFTNTSFSQRKKAFSQISKHPAPMVTLVIVEFLSK